jgi:hypothetical protein
MTDTTTAQVQYAVVAAFLDAAGQPNAKPNEATVSTWLAKTISEVLNSTSGDVYDSALVVVKRTDEKLWAEFPTLGKRQIADETWLTGSLKEKALTYADNVEAKVRKELEQNPGGCCA